jgi:hypothetical protein
MIVVRCSEDELVKSIFLIVLLTSLVSTGCAQDRKPDLHEEIRKGEITAILKAGSTGDRNYVPDLRAQLRVGRKAIGTTPGSAQMVLAKLGEAEQMKEVFCELYDLSNPVIQDEAVKKLAYVGGYGSIRALETLLRDDPTFTGGRSFPPPPPHSVSEARFDEVTYGELSHLAVDALAGLVPGQPIPKTLAKQAHGSPPTLFIFPLLPPSKQVGWIDRRKEAQIWRDWYLENDPKLRALNLEPQYSSLDFTALKCGEQKKDSSNATDRR